MMSATATLSQVRLRIRSDDRFVPLAGAFNFRDLGGYATQDGRRVRSGLLYRSDTLHRLTDADVELLRGLELRTVIDLRAADELEEHGPGRLGGNVVVVHNLPMFDDTRTLAIDGLAAEDAIGKLAELYVRMLERGGPALARTVELLAAPDALPAVFHCMAGKDRTGIVAAVLLQAMGVADDVIAKDYAISTGALRRAYEWWREQAPESERPASRLPDWILASQAGTMLRFLGELRARHRSARGLLTDIGVDPPTLDRLAATLLEPAV